MPHAFVAVLFVLASAVDGVREAPPQPQQQAPQLTRLPQLMEFHPAVYPPEALEKGITADIHCTIDIDANGLVSAASVDAQAALDEHPQLTLAFNEAAIAAIKQFKFAPAEFDDKPAPVRIQYVYHFVLSQIEKKAVAAEEPKIDPDAGIIEGEIREAGTRRPLAGADISMEGSEISASTGKDGRFSIGPISPGIHRISISLGGYSEGTSRVKLAAREHAQVTVYLRRSEPGELSATVRGDRPTDAPTVHSLSQAELENVPGALNDPIRAVQNLPGLARAPFLSGALIVRGSSPADTGIYIDGDKVPLIFHFLGGPSILPDSMLDRIDFYPGGYGAYYGRNLTGALDVTTRGGAGSGFHGEASIDLLQSALFVEVPIDDSTRISAAVRRSYIDIFLPLFLKTDSSGATTSVVPVYYDYQVRVDHKFQNGDTLDIFGFGSDDKLALVQTGPKLAQPLDLSTHIGLNRLHGTWKHSFSSDLQLVVSPSIGEEVTSFDFSGTGEGALGSSQGGAVNDLSAGLRSELRWQAAPFAQLRFGLDSLFDRANITANVVSTKELVGVGPAQTVAVSLNAIEPFQQWGEYVESDFKLGRVELVPGLRFDELHAKGNTQLSSDPRLWVRTSLDHDDAIKTYIGLYHQAPQPQQLLPNLGNPNLGLESAVQVGVGYERKFSDVWNASVEIFYNRQWGLVEPVAAQVQANGTLVNKIYDNVGVGRAYGLELLIRREITSTLYGWLSYTLSRSQIIDKPGDQWSAFIYDQPHILTVVLGWRPSVGWELSSRFRYTSGDPTAPILNATFDADSGSYEPEKGTFGDSRAPAFAELDGRAQYTWTWDLFRLTLYIDVENITNRKNPEFVVYDYRYRQSGVISGLPILPTLGVTGKW